MADKMLAIDHLEIRTNDGQAYGWLVPKIPTPILELLKGDIERELDRRDDIQRIANHPMFRRHP